MSCLALSGLAAITAAGQEGATDLFSSEAASLRFVVPAGSQVYEREIHLDGPGEAPASMVSIRIVPRGLTEERSLLADHAVIEVHRLRPGTSLREWAARGASPGGEWTERSLTVGGQPGLRRQRQGAGGETLTQVFVVKGDRGYRFSARGAANEAVLQAILETVRFEAEGVAQPAAAPVTPLGVPEVRMIYLVPSDRAVSEPYRYGMDKAIRQLQVFYRTQIANGETFSLHAPVVEVVPTPNPVIWYTTNAPSTTPEARFWESVLADGFALTGGQFDDPSNRWVFYIDADPLCLQFVGATSGVGLLPANDLRGLTCGTNQPPCGGPPDLGGLCRWVGGLGHELGHTFNLPHPTPGTCPPPDTACNNALMWAGYAAFPNAYLLPSEVNSLLTSPLTAQFFTPLFPGPLLATCSDGCNPSLSIDDVAVVEGNTGTTSAVFTVSLASPSASTVSVAFATADGTAVNGQDYAAASGTVTFPPFATAESLAVQILGDTAVEPDETFFVNLTAPVNAVLGDGQGAGTIVDDDAPSLSSHEIHHGSRHRADLGVRPDFFRLGQKPYSSYEIVVDATSGDIVPVSLVRLAGNNLAVLQSASAIGAGASVSLRWQNTTALTIVNQHIRVDGSCPAVCGAEDVYQVQALETTYSIPRFNNAGSQSTVLLLQNPAEYAVAGHIWFWDTAGTGLGVHPFGLGPKRALVLNTTTVPGVAGQGGTITISHDGRYGDLAGKAVALEPSTGFSFDSSMVARSR